MNDIINPMNYQGVSAVVVGYVSGAARNPAYDKEGSSGVKEISIPINEGYKKNGEWIDTGTTWYTYSAAGDYAAGLTSLNKGDKIRIDDAKQEVREYTTRDGDTKLGINLRYGTITVLEAAGGGAASSGDGFAPDDGKGF